MIMAVEIDLVYEGQLRCRARVMVIRGILVRPIQRLGASKS